MLACERAAHGPGTSLGVKSNFRSPVPATPCHTPHHRHSTLHIRHRWGDIKEVGIINPQQVVARIVRRVGVEGLRLRVRQCVRVSVGVSKGEVVSSVSSKGASSSSTSIRDCEAESVRWMEASSCRRPVAVGAASASGGAPAPRGGREWRGGRRTRFPHAQYSSTHAARRS